MARNIIRLVVLLVLLGVVAGGSWYWRARPAHVQAAIADVRTATKRVDVMTVEAVSEDGASWIAERQRTIGAGEDGRVLAGVRRATRSLTARVTAVVQALPLRPTWLFRTQEPS